MENNILQENFKKLNTVDNIKIFNDLEILVGWLAVESFNQAISKTFRGHMKAMTQKSSVKPFNNTEL